MIDCFNQSCSENDITSNKTLSFIKGIKSCISNRFFVNIYKVIHSLSGVSGLDCMIIKADTVILVHRESL